VYVFTTLAGSTVALRSFGLLPFVFKFITEMYRTEIGLSGIISGNV